jgi:hypothetical protein
VSRVLDRTAPFLPPLPPLPPHPPISRRPVTTRRSSTFCFSCRGVATPALAHTPRLSPRACTKARIICSSGGGRPPLGGGGENWLDGTCAPGIPGRVDARQPLGGIPSSGRTKRADKKRPGLPSGTNSFGEAISKALLATLGTREPIHLPFMDYGRVIGFKGN